MLPPGRQPLRHEHVGQIVVCLREIRRQVQRPATAGHRVVEPLQFPRRIAQVVMRPCEVRSEVKPNFHSLHVKA
jgi:hypothetical protein